jgi:nitronate monooxygenase
MWANRRFLDLVGIDLPIILAPMAEPVRADLTVAVAEAGGLGSLPGAALSADQIRAEFGIIRQRTSRPLNLNFFCHRAPTQNAVKEAAWRLRLKPYYTELGLDFAANSIAPRAPFDHRLCDLVVELKPEVVSFHFGLPEPALVDRVKATGAKILSSATTVEEARWLEARGCDAVIAQGFEAGGHPSTFLSDRLAAPVGTLALVPQVADAVRIPVIAAGGITDARAVAAAFVLGASAVQIGTAYLFCPEARVSPMHRAALSSPRAARTALTNIFTGRPARAIVNRLIEDLGPMADEAPEFPLAIADSAPLRAKSEARGSDDFVPLWAGQAAALGRALPAGELTRWLASEAVRHLQAIADAHGNSRANNETIAN